MTRDVRLAALAVPGDPEPWTDLGFTVDGCVIPMANGGVRLGVPACGIEVASGVPEPADIEGIPVAVGVVRPGVAHANGAVELDHVVIMTDSLERTSGVVESVLGLEQRRMRETATVRQAFHRFDDPLHASGVRGCIVELVENPKVERTTIWGLVVIVDDIDATVATANGLIGAPKDAVQPGRRIATVGRAAGLPLAVALMSR